MTVFRRISLGDAPIIMSNAPFGTINYPFTTFQIIIYLPYYLFLLVYRTIHQ